MNSYDKQRNVETDAHGWILYTQEEIEILEIYEEMKDVLFSIRINYSHLINKAEQLGSHYRITEYRNRIKEIDDEIVILKNLQDQV